MPQDVNFGSYFGAPQRARLYGAAPAVSAAAPFMHAAFLETAEMPQTLFSRVRRAGAALRSESSGSAETDELIRIASELEPDGGLPGKDSSDRAARSAAALLAFVAAGHTDNQGAFRLHVQRLLAFLRSLAGLPAGECEVIRAVVQAAASGTAWEGDWLRVARNRSGVWRALNKAAAAHNQASQR
jgi:hypothetical protein